VATSLKKLKIGDGNLTAVEVVGYLSDPQDVGDYYTEDGRGFLTWLATERAKTLFALGPRVSASTLERLIEGRDPVTGKLIRRYGPDGTMVGAIDLTVSPAPKSVSILWALGDDQLRYELEVMVGQAVDAAVGRMLDEQQLTRERFGPGPRDVAPAVARDYVAVQVMHTAARLSGNGSGVPDPQLHVHNLLIGAVDERDRLRAFDSLAVMRYRAELDAEASGYLAELLRQRGFVIERRLERRQNGQPRVVWEVAGIPASLVRAMSSRTAEIEDLQRRYGELYGREPTGPAWEAWIALQRGPKAHLSSAELRVLWELDAERHGLDRTGFDVLVTDADRRRAAGIEDRGEHSPEAMELRRLMLENINRDHAFVPVREMDRLGRQLAVGLLDPLMADRVIANMVAGGDLLITTDDQVTTPEVLRAERRVRAAAERLLAAPPPGSVGEELVERELTRRAEAGHPFDQCQAAAIRLAVSGAGFVSITGPAGTGKGYASSAMTALWQQRGRRVIAVAVAGRTAQQAAADAGADEPMNIDLLLARLEQGIVQLGRNDVLLVDEAGTIDHARYAPLLEAAAKSGATLVQIGDDHQLSPVGPGGLWTTTHLMAEAAGRAVELDVVRRARDRREVEAWGDLRRGEIAAALVWMRDQGRLTLYETRPELRTGMVAAWWVGDRDGLMVVDTSNEERDELNRLAQARRLEAGELGRESVRLANGRELRRGDRVLFSAIHRPAGAPDRRRERRVENGTQAVVVDVDPIRRRVVLDLREGDRARRLEVAADAPVELGYARHVAKAQGVTHEDTDLATSWATRRNELYVMATRSRAGARVHAVVAELAEGELAAAEAVEAGVAGPAITPMTDAQADLLERCRVIPDPGWSWVQASLAIDAAMDAPSGRQAALWLRALGHSAEMAERIVEQARGGPAAALPPGATAASDVLAQIEKERARREAAIEHATIRAIHRRAEQPSTKEAVGERQMQDGVAWRADRQETVEARVQRRAERNADRGVVTRLKWERSLNRGRAGAPVAAVVVAREAGRGQVPPRPSRAAIRAPYPMPAHDLQESVLGRRESAELTAALGYYQLVERLEQTADPATRAVELLAARTAAVVVATSADLWRQIRELAEAAGQPLEARGQPRVLQAEAAYLARRERRTGWLAEQPRRKAHLVEPGAIPFAHVVTADPLDAVALTQALSVAAESHVVTQPLAASLAQEVATEADRVRAALAARTEGRRNHLAARARQAAYERTAEDEEARPARQVSRMTPEPAREPAPVERGGAER
jgi:conjugative relaxase-like TrwC/TraI family protein